MLSHTVDPVHVHVCLVPGFPASAHSLLRIHFTSTSVVTRLATPSGQIFARKGIQREDAAVCYPSQPALWLSLHCCSAHSRRASHHVSPTLRSKPFLQPILMTVRHIVRQSCHPNFHTHTHTHGSRGYRKEGVHSVSDPCACVLERLQCVRGIVRVVVRVCMRAQPAHRFACTFAMRHTQRCGCLAITASKTCYLTQHAPSGA